MAVTGPSQQTEDQDVPSLHPQNDRVGDEGLDLGDFLDYYRFPPVFITDTADRKHETPLCPHVKGRPHRMICREEALYVLGERWCDTCRYHASKVAGTGWTDPRYR